MKHVTLFCYLVFLAPAITIAADDAAKPQSPSPKFELRDGDRVVFLGNTLIERAQKYGYWETMLTARYPDRDITFRNLGWSGDTVWAESRGIFDPPAVGYKRMIEHVGRLKPTVIFAGYGNNEAFAGQDGLPAFIKQYNTLLDDLTTVSAEGVRFVLLSPTWIRPDSRRRQIRLEQNENRKTYGKAIAQLCKSRNVFHIDFYSKMRFDYRADVPNERLTDLHWQMTDRGYDLTGFFLDFELLKARQSIEEQFGHESRVELSKDGKLQSQAHLKAGRVKLTDTGMTVEISAQRLPIDSLTLKIAGLPKGKYEVRIGRQVFARTDNKALSKGLPFLVSYTDAPQSERAEMSPHEVQYQKLRQAIIDKNRLYFYRWRPQNITYLFGFRKHEQGQNAKELAQFDKLIAAKQKEINKLKKPVPHTYEIIRVKKGKK